ncbi:hypothetical protein VTL71DRAFT_11007, partial [Oculimacula yallundae]
MSLFSSFLRFLRSFTADETETTNVLFLHPMPKDERQASPASDQCSTAENRHYSSRQPPIIPAVIQHCFPCPQRIWDHLNPGPSVLPQ